MADGAFVPATGPSRVARGARGAVVAPHHLATAAGLAVLAAGGHAVDAAIATNAVLGVVMPSGCGIGGDAFWLVWDEAAGEQVAMNGSGRAPAGGLRAGAPRPRASSGSRSEARSGSPCPARSGPGRTPTPDGAACRVTPYSPRRSSTRTPASPCGTRSPSGSSGRPRRSGTSRGPPASAASGSRAAGAIGRRPGPPPGPRGHPADARRRGLRRLLRRRARRTDRAGLAAAGAPYTAEDLGSHHTEWTTPIHTTYRGVRVTTHPPNSSGLIALEIAQRARPVGTTRRRPLRRSRLVGRRVAPPPARGGQARVRRPRRVPRRPGVPRRPRRPPPGRRPCGRPGRPHRPGARRPGAARRADPRRRDDLPRGRRCRGQRRQPDPVERRRLRLAASSTRTPASTSRTAAPRSRSTPPAPTSSSPASARRTR